MLLNMGNPLGLRILVLVLITNAFLSAIATAVQLYASYQRQSTELSTEVQGLEQGYHDSLTNALWAFNEDQINLILDALAQHSDVEYLQLTADGQQLMSREKDNISNTVAVQKIDLIFTTQRRGDVKIGELNIGFSRARIWEYIYAQILVVFLSNIAKTTIASIVLLVIINYILTRHLNHVAAHVRSHGRLEAAPVLRLNRRARGAPDALDEIVDAINDAQDQVARGIVERDKPHKLLQLILDTSTSAIVGLDKDGQVLSMNPAARHMMGGETREVPFDWPKDIVFLKREDLRPLDKSSDPIHRSLVGSTLRGETNLMTRPNSDRPRYVRVSSAPVPGDDQPLRTVIVLDDVSEQENHRQQIERAGRLDALGQLTGGIAHDFNNLLATILYAVQLIDREALPPNVRRYLETVLSSVKRGSSLTKRLLAFAKRQPGEATSRRLGMTLQELDLLVRPTIESSIVLKTPEEVDDLWVYCDHVQLENALLNLVLNARDAIVRSGKGSSIEISARAIDEIGAHSQYRIDDPSAYVSSGMHKDQSLDSDRADGRALRYVEIAVTDNGPGMNEEVRRRAVDPFFTTKSSNSGTGLGLSMAYGFVQQSNGELRIYSEEGHGTTIRIILPRGTMDGSREAPMDRVALPEGGGKRVLVVEDEAALLDMMEELLQSMGYEILRAHSGTEALAHIDRGEAFDVLLTDIVMPGMGGFELARRIRQHRPEVAIVYMSGYAGFGENEMGDVVAPMVRKPSPPAELASALSAAVLKVAGKEGKT